MPGTPQIDTRNLDRNGIDVTEAASAAYVAVELLINSLRVWPPTNSWQTSRFPSW